MLAETIVIWYWHPTSRAKNRQSDWSHGSRPFTAFICSSVFVF